VQRAILPEHRRLINALAIDTCGLYQASALRVGRTSTKSGVSALISVIAETGAIACWSCFQIRVGNSKGWFVFVAALAEL